MQILIIGNGFDLAHGLPTRYIDFLKQVKNKSEFYDFVEYNNNSGLFNKVKNSTVFNYFKDQSTQNKGWVDFENEIKTIINDICDFPDILERHISFNNNIGTTYLSLQGDNIKKISPFIYRLTIKSSKKTTWTIKEFSDLEKNIHTQISNFIKLFKIYITWIKKTYMEGITKQKIFVDMKVDRLLSFNYTTTFLELYCQDNQLSDENICYVHGKIDTNKDTRIVMGVGSDFYDENRHDKFVEFFKFFQRYKYETNNNYKHWISEQNELNSSAVDMNLSSCYIHLFGHSLDPTDGDILKPLFNLDNTKVYVHYLDQRSQLDLEKNLLKILGKSLFIEYLSAEDPKIIFKKI